MKTFVYVLIALCAIFSTSCASRKKINYERQSIFINAGMSKQEVVDVMGTPGDRQFNGTNEAWQYHRNGFWGGYDKIYIVWFYRNVVVGLTTRSQPTTGMAAVYYPVNWEEMPDYTIEIRNR